MRDEFRPAAENNRVAQAHGRTAGNPASEVPGTSAGLETAAGLEPSAGPGAAGAAAKNPGPDAHGTAAVGKAEALRRAAAAARRHLEAARAIALATYKEWAAYRSHMAATILIGPVCFLVQYFIWNAIYAERDTLNGFSLDRMLAYYGVMSVITYLTFDFADWNLQMLVRTGRFVTFVLRPVSHRFYALAQKIGHRTLGFFFEFLPVFLIFLFVFRIDLMPASFGWALLSVLLGFLMTFLVNYCIGLTAFWLTNAAGVRRMFLLVRDLTAGVFLPLTFFPEAVQKVLFVLPFQFMQYVPVRVWLGEYELAGISLSVPQIVGLQALAVLVMWGVSEGLARLGMRRFTGVGV